MYNCVKQQMSVCAVFIYNKVNNFESVFVSQAKVDKYNIAVCSRWDEIKSQQIPQVRVQQCREVSIYTLISSIVNSYIW